MALWRNNPVSGKGWSSVLGRCISWRSTSYLSRCANKSAIRRTPTDKLHQWCKTTRSWSLTGCEKSESRSTGVRQRTALPNCSKILHLQPRRASVQNQLSKAETILKVIDHCCRLTRGQLPTFLNLNAVKTGAPQPSVIGATQPSEARGSQARSLTNLTSLALSPS